uniref:NOT2/NOT3/NOT5 C-terminal domain-containing protein n=1 Tax=Globisporangium ultimum (strain ATCC 200006 / CBS 805.95 / DAOM BR144) TaxID=431595 RepID=K3WB52_GLOUD
MAGQRKLMSEIDRTLKKVTEGVEVFNDIWDKVYSASAQNQKEKHEADLKKEIKKLQRFRDQIKNWIGNSDVKDKKPLTDARKLIEQKMEEFKVCEKETKTKAYSKEGLAQMDRLDPAEQARQNTRSWIQDCLTQFNEQIEATECDLERLMQSKGKNKNKSEIEALEFTLSRHKFHILKLEQINRLLDNDALDAKDVDDLKEDIEYYLEANQEPNFMDTYGDDDIYEVLDLDSLGAAMQVLLPTEQDIGLDDLPSDTNPSSSASVPVNTSNSSATTGRANSKTPKKSVSASVITGIGRPGAVKPIELKTSTSLSATPSRSASSNASLSVVTPSSKNDDSEKTDEKLSKSGVRGTPLRGNKNGSSSTPNSSNAANDLSQVVGNANKVPGGSTTSSMSAPSPTVSEKAMERKLSPQTQRTPPPARTPPPTAPPSAPKDRSAGSTPNSTVSSTGASSASGALSSISSLLSGGNANGGALGSLMPSALDETPMLSEEQRQIMRMIDESFHFIPESVDSEKANRYVPRNLYPTPASFPTAPLSVFDNATVFEKLDVDTLFFMFYYQQGSYQQYLAARELKRRTWGYHKKYKTWFKRHEEPQVTGEDYEQGTFVYFDYETGWCQRIKTEFTFEYSYLEDELL